MSSEEETKGASFNYQRRVHFHETDMAGIMHFSNFFRLMEETEHAFFRSLGFSIHHEFDGVEVGWPRVKATCDYLKPLKYEDELEIVLKVVEIREKSLHYVFDFNKCMEGQWMLAARGELTAVCVRFIEDDTGKHHRKFTSAPIPAAIKTRLQQASSI
ncbi:MAG: thioesterase family protein [Verrucomicrobiota bacterium]